MVGGGRLFLRLVKYVHPLMASIPIAPTPMALARFIVGNNYKKKKSESPAVDLQLRLLSRRFLEANGGQISIFEL